MAHGMEILRMRFLKNFLMLNTAIAKEIKSKYYILILCLVSCLFPNLGRTACFHLEHVLCVFKSCGLEINYTDRSLKVFDRLTYCVSTAAFD